MPSMRQLEYFIEVVDSGSLRKAAQKLGVTQPTLSVQLTALEQTLGVTLLERQRSASRATPAGRDLLPEARALLAQWRDLVETAHLLSNDLATTYRLGVPPTLGPYLLPTILPPLHARFERLRLHVREQVPDSLIDGLENGDYDVIMGPIQTNRDDIVAEPLFREPLLLASGIDTLSENKQNVSDRDLEGENILVLEERHALRREVAEICDRTGAIMNRDFEGTSLDTLRQMVVMGMGSALLPALYVRSEIHRPEELTVRQFADRQLYREHFLLYRRMAPSRNFYRELGELIREVVATQLADTVIPIA